MIFRRKPSSAATAVRTSSASGMPSGRPGAARSRPRLAAAVSMVCGVAVFGAANLGAVPAGAAVARTHATVLAGANAAASPNRSGLPWASGAYLPADTQAAAAAFGAWRKRPLDIAEVWTNRSTWADITDPAWLYSHWRGSPYTLVVTVPMLPAGGGASIQACAAGAYNAQWRQFGQNISSAGLGSSIIRLGWEFNGKWESWAATNPKAWAQCWRQAVTAARSTAPQLRWDWNVNRGVSSALADPTLAYPGDAYVSMIGIDSYDQWPPATSAAGWQKQLNGKQGLSYWLAFAKAHGKKLSVPEWGNLRSGKSTGGDDPQYVRDMRAFFAANAPYIAFESIFQGTGETYDAGQSMPSAALAYQAGF
jgi:Glycosyl hydrolase family 26